jgi:regulation of enolase protein 1 (concanavalin A-like superfamily)
VRFYPLKDSGGATVANAYVVAVEMETGTPDQQDLVFEIHNVKPAAVTPPAPDTTPPTPPSNLAVLNTTNEISLDWSASSSSDVAGYIIKRSTNSKTNFIQLNTSLITATAFVDDTGGPKRYYYRVFAEDTSGNLSDPAKIAATLVRGVGSTPAPQFALNSADIGNPTPSGSTNALVSGDAYDMIAGGSDVQGSSDQFRYAYTPVTGNFDRKVRVDSLSAADVWSKAGIMARTSLSASSRNVFALTSPTKYRMTYRVDNGGDTTAVGAGTPAFPNNWLRLARSGDNYTAYSSTDGSHWTVISSVKANLGKTIFVGLAATSHNPAQTTTASFRDLA